MAFKYLGSSAGCTRIQEMPLALQYICKMVGFYVSNCDRTGDEVNPIFQYVKSYRISGVQESEGILRQKKRRWILRRFFLIATS